MENDRHPSAKTRLPRKHCPPWHLSLEFQPLTANSETEAAFRPHSDSIPTQAIPFQTAHLKVIASVPASSPRPGLKLVSCSPKEPLRPCDDVFCWRDADATPLLHYLHGRSALLTRLGRTIMSGRGEGSKNKKEFTKSNIIYFGAKRHKIRSCRCDASASAGGVVGRTGAYMQKMCCRVVKLKSANFLNLIIFNYI